MLALLVFLAAAGTLGYLHRDWIIETRQPGQPVESVFERCLRERQAEIDGMLEEGLIQPAQAELFRRRAETQCEREASQPAE